jgi:hypothetical protein
LGGIDLRDSRIRKNICACRMNYNFYERRIYADILQKVCEISVLVEILQKLCVFRNSAKILLS